MQMRRGLRVCVMKTERLLTGHVFRHLLGETVKCCYYSSFQPGSKTTSQAAETWMCQHRLFSGLSVAGSEVRDLSAKNISVNIYSRATVDELIHVSAAIRAIPAASKNFTRRNKR